MPGSVAGTIDFDPGDGTDRHTASSESRHVFVARLEPDGIRGWTDTLRGTTFDIVSAAAAIRKYWKECFGP